MSDRLLEIFVAQRGLMDQFMEIEKDNGLLETSLIPVHLNSFEGQARIRNYAWRFTEELAEFLDASTRNRKVEELADALHFLVELSILAGFDPVRKFRLEDRPRGIDALESLFNYSPEYGKFPEVIRRLGMAINLLKNRPWKRTARPLDLPLFYFSLGEVFKSFGSLCADYMSPQDLYDAYFQKEKINQQRLNEGV